MANTIAENLARLLSARSAIGAAITNKGGVVNAGDGLEEFPADIGTIPTGGDTSSVLIHPTAYWDSQPTLVSLQDVLYVYSDYGIKIGDGTTYLADLPFYSVWVTESEKTYWNDKVGARVINLDTLELYK